MDQELITRITSQLARHGWTPRPWPAIASKMFDTAVGPKEAHVYLSDSAESDPNRTLQGVYYSEGNNILEPRGVLLPKAADAPAVAALVDKFAAGVEKAVAESYAGRLKALERQSERMRG